MAFSSDGKRVLSGAYRGDGTARLWDVVSGKELFRTPNIPAGVHGLALSPDGRLAIVAGDTQADLWDLDGKKLLQTFEGLHTATDAIFLPDGQHALLATYGDKPLRLWRLPK